MITVSVKQFTAAIEETDSLELPDMTVGAKYLYDNLYGRLANNIAVRLSDIDFGSFELGDIEVMRELHSDLESREYKAGTIARSLQELSPVANFAAFV